MQLFALPNALLALVSSLLLPSLVRADVQFTVPAAGVDVAVGTINVKWQNSGVAPPLTSLMAYSLILMTGGNEDSNMLALTTFVSGGTFRSTSPVSGTIPAGIAEAAPNGFFFKIISSSATGGTVINYSDRFTITGLIGYTPPQYLAAVKALNGDTAGPKAVGNAASSSSATAPTKLSTVITSSTPASVTSGSVVATTAVPTTIPGGTGSRTPTDGSSISNGALAGIAIAGAVVGVIGIALALYACFRWRKRANEPVELKLDDSSKRSQDALRREMSFAESVQQTPVELDPYATIVEAGDGMARPEMDGMNVRAELEGDIMFGEQDFGPPLTPIPSTPIENLTLDSQAGLAFRPTEPKEQI